MEEVFNKLKSEQKNTVDNLIKWLKDSKIVDGSKVTEDKARKLFSEVKDSKDIEIDKFKEVVGKLAAEKNKSPEDLKKILVAEGPKFLSAAKAAAASKK